MTTVVPNSVMVRVPGKINLQLSVGPKESDDYHNIVTVFQSVSLYDEVTVSREGMGVGLTAKISGDHTHGVPIDETNLSCRAALLM